ncbi:MAG: hypothetical protein APR63_13315 [Desulfuromonas sp. SDB]|nr:MAG: hypothetical protein APR63_13315 [Desulfuromonas sp. SDB]
MLKKSDLIIIGKVISTQDQPNLLFENNQDDSWIPVYTEFQILPVLKGDPDNDIVPSDFDVTPKIRFSKLIKNNIT